MKVITIETICTATVRETWQIAVPDETPVPDDAVAVLNGDDGPFRLTALIDLSKGEWRVHNDVDDERDRVVTGVSVDPA